MSKKAGFKEFHDELAACRKACRQDGGKGGQPCLVARVVRDLSDDQWREFCKTYSVSQWFVLPLPEGKDDNCDIVENARAFLDASPWLLDRAAFRASIGAELVRIARSGGSLCLMLLTLANRRGLVTSLGEGTVRRLEAMLRDTLEKLLESCDSLCLYDQDIYGVLLPGLGQLKSRRFAENVQRIFADEARPFFPSGGINAGTTPACAVGLVNVVPGEGGKVDELLTRAKKALDAALDDNKNHLYQESPTGESCGATLVHSNEKHFLFFGGDTK